MTQSYNLEQLPEVAKNIILQHTSAKIILFYGEMGVGKTTLIKELVKELGSEDIVSSPTFSLVNEYLLKNNKKVYHFDFYRIHNEEEALDMGIEDYLYSNDWCLIEWPDKIKNLLPLDAIAVYLTQNEDGTRNIQLKHN